MGCGKNYITRCVNNYIVGFMNRSLVATEITGFVVPRVTLDTLGAHAPALDYSKMGRTVASILLLNAGLGNWSPWPGRGRDKDCAISETEMDDVP